MKSITCPNISPLYLATHFKPGLNVTLSKHALVSMLIAAIESYKKEVYGILLGEAHRKHYKVLDTFSYQNAHRGYEAVTVPNTSIIKVNYAVQHLAHQQVLGAFHSHPDFPDHLSTFDKQQFKIGMLPIHILVLLKKSSKAQPWKSNDDLSISGTIGTKYYVKLRAFDCNPETQEIRAIKVVCPAIRTINTVELVCGCG